MKVSKVDHTAAAVAKVKQEIPNPKITGILYDNPERKDCKNNTENQTIEARVRKLNENAQRLYSILNANAEYDFTEDKEEKKFCGFACKNFGKLVAALALAGDIAKQKKILEHLPDWKIKISKKGTCIDGKQLGVHFDKDIISIERQKQLIYELTITNIRRSFRKTVTIKNAEGAETEQSLVNIVAELLWATCNVNGDYKRLYKKISDAEIMELLNHLNRDYVKDEQIKNIVRSIESQNVKVQPKKIRSGNEETVKLQLANAEHKRKQYIFKFVKEFAAGDEQKKNEMFIYIRKMMILFYCGRDVYEQLADGDVTPWGFHTKKVDKGEYYSLDIKELLQEKHDNKDNKLKIKGINQKIKELMKERIHESYKQGQDLLKGKLDEKVITNDEYEQHTYWLSYIAEKARQLYNKKIISKRLSTEFLCEYTWKEWLSFICMKYVDMGKAVYHFAMPDLTGIEKQEVIIGKVRPEYEDGLTSFDYERIKAYENFERDLTMYITFAVNNFAKAVMTDEKRSNEQYEDVLSIRHKDLQGSLREDAVRRILQFFGGQSQWPDSIRQTDAYEFFHSIVQELKIVRNGSFHYAANFQSTKKNPLIRELFENEYSRVDSVLCKKYMSNNVLMFYREQDLKGLMEQLYSRPAEREAQIPAFGKILSRNEFGEFVKKFLKNNKLEAEISTDDMKKFRSALYFVLKEVYYYDFLRDKTLKQKFVDNLKGYYKKTEQELAEIEQQLEDLKKRKQNNYSLKKKKQEIQNDWRAIDNFKKRIDQICKNKDITFGEICQQIMTDYNMQNNREMKVDIKKMDSGKKAKKENEKIYQHFRMLLYKGIGEVFVDYLREKELIYGFLKEPVNHIKKFEELSETDICSGWKSHLYDKMKQKWEQSSELSAWYMMAHFLNQRQLNLLIGVFRSHIQYIMDIDKRSEMVHNERKMDTKTNVQQYKNILSVLEFTMLFCERMTEKATDYFDGSEDHAAQEYAAHVSQYVCFEKGQTDVKTALQAFCEQIEENSPNGKIGIYYAEKPVLNKNVVKAMMYGNAKLMEACVKPVTEKEIRAYYANMKDLAKVFKNGICETEDDQRQLKQFQNQKNRIELTNITIYKEMIDDLISRLISWAYIRERDLMYFQLGYWYTKLYYGDCVLVEDEKRRIQEKKIKILDGAVLYQIVAMYNMNLPMYEAKGRGKTLGKGEGTTGKRVENFINIYGEAVYNEGLPLFEKLKDHDEVVKYRDYLDHFKYFAKLDRSILDLYSVMFDRFFDYSTKLHRSVLVVLQNILAKYSVTADVKVESGEVTDFEERHRSMAEILLDNYQSASYTYKVKQKPVDIEAREHIFLKELKQILEFSKGRKKYN